MRDALALILTRLLVPIACVNFSDREGFTYERLSRRRIHWRRPMFNRNGRSQLLLVQRRGSALRETLFDRGRMEVLSEAFRNHSWEIQSHALIRYFCEESSVVRF
jgi:hypothetical protein